MYPSNQAQAIRRFIQGKALQYRCSLTVRWLSNDDDQPKNSSAEKDFAALSRAFTAGPDKPRQPRLVEQGRQQENSDGASNLTTRITSVEEGKKDGKPKSPGFDDFFAQLEKKRSRPRKSKVKHLSPPSRRGNQSDATNSSLARDEKSRESIVSFFDRIDAIADKRQRNVKGENEELDMSSSDDQNGGIGTISSSRSPPSSMSAGKRPIADLFPVKKQRSPNAFDEASFDEYIDLVRTQLLPNKKFLKHGTKKSVTGDRAQAVIDWITSNEPSIKYNLPLLTKALQKNLTADEIANSSKIFKNELRDQRTAFMEHHGWDDLQYEAAQGALTFVGGLCAKTSNADPLEIAWKKLKEGGFLLQKDLLHNYLYVMSTFSSRSTTTDLASLDVKNKNVGGSILDFLSRPPSGSSKFHGDNRCQPRNAESGGEDDEHDDAPSELALFHDFLYGPCEQSLMIRVRKLVSRGQEKMAEQLLDESFDDNLRLRTYTPIFNSYLGQDDVSSAMNIYVKMKNAKGVILQPENCVQLMACIAENGFFNKNAEPIEGIEELGYPNGCGSKLFDRLALELADITPEISSASARRLYNAFAVGYNDGNSDSDLNPLHLLEPLKTCNDVAKPKELIVSRVTLDANTGYCPRSGVQLRLVKLDLDQKNQLKENLLQLSKDTYEEFHKAKKNKRYDSSLALSSFKRFGHWLNEREGKPFTAIVDGANIGFYMQNFEGGRFNFHQIKFVVDYLEQKKENVLVVLPYKYSCPTFNLPRLASKAMVQKLTKDEIQILNDLNQSGKLFIVDSGTLDDLYWMYASVSSQRTARDGRSLDVPPDNDDGRWPGTRPILVSNDRMRDHKVALLEPRLFRRWYSNFIVNYTFTPFLGDRCLDSEIAFRPADFYSREIQGNPTFDDNGIESGTAWHFPISDWDVHETLCVRIPR